MKLLAYASIILLFLAPAASASECGSCVERKGKMCAQECRLVQDSRVRECQNDCIKEYCSHRCKDSDPELQRYLAKDCDQCLDQQFNLCDPNCQVGTDRERAVCKLDCSAKHCQDKCTKPEEPAVTEEKAQGEKTPQRQPAEETSGE